MMRFIECIAYYKVCLVPIRMYNMLYMVPRSNKRSEICFLAAKPTYADGGYLFYIAGRVACCRTFYPICTDLGTCFMTATSAVALAFPSVTAAVIVLT